MKASLLLFCLFCAKISALVVGLDYGSLYLKASLVKPGTVGDIVLNEQSQRKTPVAVGFYNGDRYFGVDAVKLLTKKPGQTYIYTAELLGRSYDHPLVNQILDFFPHQLEQDPDRGTYLIRHSENETFTPETIVAMMMKKVKDLSGNFADTVISVPPWLTQHERQALIQAAELGGMNVLALMNSGAAWATGYGVTRTFEEATRIMFLDMGHSSFTATVAAFEPFVDERTNKTYTQMTIEGVGYDRTLGGRMFDKVLAQRFADKAALKIGKETVMQPKVWQKLLSEAQKVKEILSANQETPVNIEGLTPTFDFRDHIKRVEFESLCSSLLNRVTAPIQAALKMAGVEANALNFVEIVGGGIRVPRVQAIVKEVLGRPDLDRHMNGDEGAVQGAAFYAALQSPLFKVKDFRVRDAALTSIGVTLFDGTEEKQTNLFGKGNRFGSKKTLAFSTDLDFTMKLAYNDPDTLPAGSSAQIALHSVSGLPTTDSYNFTGKPKVSCSYRLVDGSALLQDCDAEINVTVLREVKPPKEAPKPKKEVPETAEENKIEEEDKSAQSSPDSVEGTESVKDKDEKEKEKEKTEEEVDEEEEEEVPEVPVEKVYKEVVLLRKVHLKVETEYLGLRPLTKLELASARSQLSQIRRKEDEKKELEQERNNLETFLYSTRDNLDKAFIKEVSTDAEREALQAALTVVAEWLDYGSAEATASAFRTKLSELRAPFDKFEVRASERAGRTKAVASFNKYIESTIKFLPNITERYEVKPEDIEEVVELCDKATAWLTEKLQEQEKLQPYEDPAFLLSDLSDKSKTIDRAFRALTRKPVKKPKKPTKKPEDSEAEEKISEEKATEDAEKAVEDDATKKPEHTEL